ncbi:MAG TPA: hypothetical protein VJ302_10750 [Blastocatellia bacterium]|nr:hypothetical protein [Blastocatellia bacterium]
MLNLFLILTSIISLGVIPNQAAAPQSPRILKGLGGLVLPEKMKAAVNKFNPKFAVWRLQDYAPQIARGDQYAKPASCAPFAVIVDVNKDGILDVILDGHDDQKKLLIGVVSDKQGYRVIKIYEDELIAPKTIKNSFDGKQEFGLGYYLINGDGRRVIFEIHTPQQSDAKGELLTDGSITEYSYKKGKFIESTQIL